MYTNIEGVVSNQLLENEINKDYHLIEVSATGIDCKVFMTLVKLHIIATKYFLKNPPLLVTAIIIISN